MNWRVVAVGATLVPVVVIVVQFDIRPQDMLAIGAVPFVVAILLMMAKLGLQGIKFSYIARSYLGRFDSVGKLSGVRVGSEFIKFSTPMFVGAELVVIYYLHKKKVPPSKSAWVALVDIVTEVMAGGALSILAGVLAVLAGAYAVGAAVLGISIPITAVWTVLFFLSSRREFRVPGPLRRVASRLAGARGTHYMDETDMWLQGICRSSREHSKSKKSRTVLVNSLLLSLASWIMYGLSFTAITLGAAYYVGTFDSVMAVMAANAIGNLPVTVGGSGLAELGVFAYLNDANPFDFNLPHGGVEWNAIVGWRMATYYIPLAVTWLLLVRLALSRVSRSDVARA